MVELGETLYFSMGSDKNLKITTVGDIDMFKALYKTKRDEWLKQNE
jgi:2-C-methyl-D-erythritol 4-phosphate cytidylyltransferase